MKTEISRKKYIIARVRQFISESIANINDKSNLTSIFESRLLKENKTNIIKADKDYRLISFGNLPLNMVGFIAKISSALAEEKIPMFIISSYYRDHILIKNKYLRKGVIKLKSIKFIK